MDFQTLWDEAVTAGNGGRSGLRSAKKARTETSSIPVEVERRVRALAAEGAPGKALSALQSEGLHDPNEPAVVEKLKGLHPASASDVSALPASILCPFLDNLAGEET